jgi:hypothetical protein
MNEHLPGACAASGEQSCFPVCLFTVFCITCRHLVLSYRVSVAGAASGDPGTER